MGSSFEIEHFYDVINMCRMRISKCVTSAYPATDGSGCHQGIQRQLKLVDVCAHGIELHIEDAEHRPERARILHNRAGDLHL